MNKENNFKVLAEALVDAVGGKENVVSVVHCMTRLRFSLKDKSIPNQEIIKKLNGVIGVVEAGGQLQIIIGQTVDKVYAYTADIVGIQKEVTVEKVKEKLTLKSIGNGVLDGLSGSLTPIIPILIAASMFKLLVALFGPGMLNVMAADSDMYILFEMVGDAGFYFFPIILGYTSAKKFGGSIMIGMFLGAIMLHPTIGNLIGRDGGFTVYGITANLQNYSSTIFPIIMSTFVMTYVEKGINKFMPLTFKTIFTPFLTVLIMLPILLCVLGPAGGFLGTFVCNAILSLEGLGFIAVAIIAMAWQFLVMTGMQLVMIATMITIFSSVGYDAVVSPAACVASLGCAGLALGAALRLKNKEEKALCFGYLIAATIGGVTEPTLYGVCMRYKRPFIALAAGGFLGGLYAGITGVTSYAMVPVASFLGASGFMGGSTMNFVNGIIAILICFFTCAILTYFFGFAEDDLTIK